MLGNRLLLRYMRDSLHVGLMISHRDNSVLLVTVCNKCITPLDHCVTHYTRATSWLLHCLAGDRYMYSVAVA